MLPIKLSTKLFDLLIRPVLLYNCEIWFMDDYISTFRSIQRSKRNNTNCDILKMEDKYNYEKIHIRFCKSVLGLKKTACNISAKCEIGRHPLTTFIKTQILKYLFRINADNINPLVKEAYYINKSLHNEGIYTWYTLAKSINEEIGTNVEDSENQTIPFEKAKHVLKKTFNKNIQDIYSQKTMTKLASFDENSKLYLYSKLKSKFKTEEFLEKVSNFKTRQSITKLRVSDHILEIEQGRYRKIPRNQRICKFCNLNQVDDECHFFLKCQQNNEIRKDLFSKISETNPNFRQEQDINKLKIILNPNFEFLTCLGDFIKQSFILRT